MKYMNKPKIRLIIENEINFFNQEDNHLYVFGMSGVDYFFEAYHPHQFEYNRHSLIVYYKIDFDNKE